mmetsp:Transcript_12119/g.13537  ORF Transcript_12119/g.13537 Transcript_12119/m.13537 type:complete len:83 (+) Transcript_12119:53-301(+)
MRVQPIRRVVLNIERSIGSVYRNRIKESGQRHVQYREGGETERRRSNELTFALHFYPIRIHHNHIGFKSRSVSSLSSYLSRT